MKPQPGGSSPTGRDRLDLVAEQVQLQDVDGNITRRPVSHFLALSVNGRSLADFLLHGGDFVTNLNRAWSPGVVPEAVSIFLGTAQEPDLDSGRIPLLVCAACGDIGCGALTAALTLTEETVTWAGFRWADWSAELRPVEGLPNEMCFDRVQYEEEFAHAVERVRELPYDEEEHKLRRFLWPWQWGWRLPPRNEE